MWCDSISPVVAVTMTYKLIALDIDGTIRDREQPVSQRTIEAVQRARRMGAVVTVVTGRMFQSALQAVGDLELLTPIIVFQGAVIADPLSHEVIWHQPLTEKMVGTVLTALDHWDFEIVAHCGDDVFVNRASEWGDEYGVRNGVEVRVVADLRLIAGMGVTRLVAVGPEDAVAELTDRMNTQFGSSLQIARTLPFFCEILHPDASKAKALTKLCDGLGISASDVVAFGNGLEDLPVLEWAGLGIAVSDGHPDLLPRVQRLARPLYEDGVAQVIEDLLAKEKIG